MNYIEREKIFTFKDFVIAAREFAYHLYSLKWWIILAMGIGMGISLFMIKDQKITYTAKLNFVVNNNNAADFSWGKASSMFSGRPTLAGGINLDKLIELVKSEKIMEDALFQKIEIANKSDYLANHMLSIYEKWEEIPKNILSDSNKLNGFKGEEFRFVHANFDSFSSLEQFYFTQIYFMLVGNSEKAGLINLRYGDRTGILSLQIKSINEQLSIKMSEVIYSALSSFYITDKTRGLRHTLRLLKSRADSIKFRIDILDSKLKQTYLNEKFITNKEVVQRTQMNREAGILTVMQGEVLKNREAASFMLQNYTPLFQILSRPHRSIRPDIPSRIMYLFLGANVGFFVSIIFLFLRKLIQDALV